MDNNETGVKVPKGQINLNTVLGAIGTAGALGNRLAPRKSNPGVEENPAAVGQQGQTMEG